MAHFCELNNDNLIIAAIEVSSNVAPTEEAGIAFLKNLYKDPSRRLIQTWPDDDGKRKQQGSIGFTYDAVKDEFIRPKPFPSWALDEDNEWQPPVAQPEATVAKKYVHWDEAKQEWNDEGPATSYR